MTEYEIQVLQYLERIDQFLYNYLFPALIIGLSIYIIYKSLKRVMLL